MVFIKKGEKPSIAKEMEIRRIIEESTGFTLPVGVFPCDSNVILYCGFQYRPQIGTELGEGYYTLAVSQTRELIFDAFLDLLNLMFNPACHARVVICREENFPHSREKLSYNSKTYLPLLLSILPDYERLFVDDGYVGIDVIQDNPYLALQLSPHKTIIAFASERRLLFSVAEFLQKQGIREVPHLKALIDVHKVHVSSPVQKQQFEKLMEELEVV